MADIFGTEFNELLVGTAEDDILIGYSGYDTLDGGEGSDTYIVNANDFQNRFVKFYQDSGTSGTDVILAAEAGVTIGIGSGFSYASSGIEVIDGLSGSIVSGDNDRQVWDFTNVEIKGVDVLYGMGGHDEIRGSNGDDGIDGGQGHDVLFGGLGNDTISGGTEHDQLYGGEGDDVLNGNAGYDYLDGGEGSDVYVVGLDNGDFVDEYNDTGTSGTDEIRALEAGTVIGLMSGFGPNSGIELISADGHSDVTIGGTNDAEVWDFSNTNLSGVVQINALDGHDKVIGNDQYNRIDAGDGNDYVDAGGGNDVLFGGNGFDILLGGSGRDYMLGGAGNDFLDGGEDGDVYLYFSVANDGFDEIIDTGTSGRDIILAADDSVELGLGMSFSLENGIEIISRGRNSNLTIQGSDEGNNWNFDGVLLYGVESINSGDGMDIVRGNDRADVINGEAGHDQIYGGGRGDILSGGDDSDFLFGEEGADFLYGDAGNDILTGGADNDTLTGGAGYDIFVFGPDSGRDVIKDFNVNDDLIDLTAYNTDVSDVRFSQNSQGITLFIGSSIVFIENVFRDDMTLDNFIFVDPDTISDEDDMEIQGSQGDDVLEGGSGDDTIKAANGDDTVYGNDGDDVIYGEDGDDALHGGEGHDELVGSDGNDSLFGENGDDMLDGGSGNDQLDGGEGNDTLLGSNGKDTLIGGAGDDRLDGGTGNDTLEGGDGDDYLYGFKGNDILNGGAGNDTLIGYNGKDVLTGGEGNDSLIGGWGKDTFVFGENSGNDTIQDYEDGRDILEFRDLVDDFSDLIITQDGDNTVITSANGTVTLLDTDSSLLDASDFFFG